MHRTLILCMHTPQPTIYGFGRNVHLWHFPWPKRPWPKCSGRNVRGRNVRGRNVLHSMELSTILSDFSSLQDNLPKFCASLLPFKSISIIKIQHNRKYFKRQIHFIYD